MPDVIPQVVAAPEAMPFLRWVQAQITALQTVNAQNAQYGNNTLKGQNALIANVGNNLANLSTRFTNALTALTLDASVIVSGVFALARIPSLPASQITGGTLSVGMSTTASVVANGGLASSGARANTITSYIAAQLDPSGNIGIVSSSVNVKQDFRPVDMSSEVAAVLQIALLEFRYISLVEEFGDQATFVLGGIAQYFDAIGLGRYLSYDIDGEIDGIQYDQLTKPLIATVQFLDKRLTSTEDHIASLERRVAALEAKSS